MTLKYDAQQRNGERTSARGGLKNYEILFRKMVILCKRLDFYFFLSVVFRLSYAYAGGAVKNLSV